jgi:myo-inositol 2-dehydrogenase/D-chiro-inositol 1-dehydrogenase
MSKFKIALLGLEQPHADFWQVAFRNSPHCEFAGAWSQTPGLAKQKAEQFGYDAWEDRSALIDCVDAVAICSVTSQHFELIEEAAIKGKKILSEKPLATSIEHCDAIQAVLERTGAFFMQGFPKRFDPVNHEIKRIIDSGGLGHITMVRVRHGHPVGMLNADFDKTWFVDPQQGGGGCLLDEGLHGADFVRWLFGEPEEVTCFTSDVALPIPVEDTAIAIYRFANGLLAEVSSCWHFMAAQNSVEIFGTNGSIVLSGVDLGSRDVTEEGYLKYYIHPAQKDDGSDPLGPKDREWTVSDIVPQFKIDTEVFHRNVAQAFIDTIVDGKEPPITVIDGRRAVEMILAAYKSAKSGKVEKIHYG